MMICPLIRGFGCTVPLCAMRINPSFRQGTPTQRRHPALASRDSVWTRNVPLDDIPDLGFRLLFMPMPYAGNVGNIALLGILRRLERAGEGDDRTKPI